MTSEAIKKQIIDWKCARLAGETELALPEQLALVLNDDPALQEELAFIEAFWTVDALPEQLPSPSVRENFYDMLSKAERGEMNQQILSQQQVPQQHVTRRSWFKSISDWLALNPGFQFAALALCFGLGFVSSDLRNDYTPDNRVNEGLGQLEAQVASLSTMVAISMLQKQSASDRLNGLVYSRQTNLQDPQLIGVLMEMLANDKSVSVRLAIAETLIQYPGQFTDSAQFIDLITEENNPLVQMELSRLVAAKGTTTFKMEVFEALSNKPLSEEVLQVINELRAFSQA